MFAPILLWYMYLLATNIPITKSVSVCEEIDIVCLIDVNAIKHSAGDVIEFIDNLVLKGSAEQSSVTVAVYGEVPKAGENIIQEEIFLINAEETIGITKGRKTKQEYIRNKLLSLTETMFSKSKIENLDLANIINNIAPSSKPKEFIVIQYDNDIFTSTSNCNLAQLYSQNMHFIMNDNYNSQSTTNCAPANIDIQNFNEIKSNMEIIYKFTCPTPVIDLGQDIGTLALSNHANIVNLNAIIGCKLEFTDTNALKDTSTVTVIDDLEDDMTFEVDEYLVIHKNDFDLLSEECKYPVFKINEIEQSTDSTNSLKILILHVTTPSLFDYISELHVDATNINLESATKTPAPTSPPTFNGEIITDELVIQAHQDASFHENWKWEKTFNEKNVPDRVNPTGFGQLTPDAFFLPKLVLAFGDVDVSIESSLSADYSINFLVEFWWDWAKAKLHLEQFKLTIDGYMDLTIDVDIDIAAQFFFVVPTIFNAESQKILWMGFVGVPIVPLLNVDFMISSPELHITLTPKYKVEYDFELGVAYNSEKGWYNIENINKKEQISSGLQLSTDMTFDGCQVGIPFGLGFRISAGVELYEIIQLTTNLHLWGKSKLNIPGESGGNAICEKDPLEAVINTDFTLSMTIEAFFTGEIPYLKINPNDLWLGRWIYQIPFLHDVPIGEVQISFPLNNQLDQFFRGLCCDIPAPEAAPTVAPYWNFMNEQITYSTNGKCIGIDVWNDLYIYDCNGENNQAWTMRAFDGLISNANNDNLCLEADGEWPKLKTCTGASNQMWQLISTGLSFMIMNEQNCLSKFDNTDRLKVTACGSNDQWILGTQIPATAAPTTTTTPSPTTTTTTVGVTQFTIWTVWGAGFVTEATIEYYERNGRKITYGPYHASIGDSIDFNIPNDATRITVTANAVSGSNIFTKYFATTSNVNSCNGFDVWGTSWSPDYSNNMGGHKTCNDI